MSAKIQRVVDTAFVNSAGDAESIEYNPASGGKKSLTVGPRLLPIPVVSAGLPSWTTNISAATALPKKGVCMAIYNNAGSAASVTVGQDNTVTAQAIGAFDANGNVGVACPPNTYTYISLGNNQWIIGSTSTLIAYIIEDPTSLIQQGPTATPQQNPRTWLPITS